MLFPLSKQYKQQNIDSPPLPPLLIDAGDASGSTGKRRPFGFE
jgi:hypothetical protein